MKQFWVLLIVSLLGIKALPLNAQRVYTKSTVCHVLNFGTASRHKNVEIHANVMADHRHSALLIDPKCPGKGLFLDVSPADADKSVTDFDHVLWSDDPPGFDTRTVSGTFFGVLNVGKNLPLNQGHKKLSLALIRVENISDARSHQRH